MRIPFRQGLARTPAGFLSVGSGTVSLVVPANDSVIVTIADGLANYLITERTSITNAWTGLPGSDSWLYWDIDVISAEKSFGYTVLQPVAQSIAPQSPANDQHWFDTSTYTMKVWRTSANKWVRRVRVFACKLQGGSVPVSMGANSPAFNGTQIGAFGSYTAAAGAFVFDADGYALRKQNGTFFTTEDQASTSIASSSQVKLGSLVITAEASANIAAYSIVRFTDYNKIISANNYLVDNGAYGIVEIALAIGETANVVLEGLITNVAWDFTIAGGGSGDLVRFPAPLDVNAPLYIDSVGYLTSVAPTAPIVIAAVVDKSTILLRPSSLFMDTTNDPATTSDLGTVLMSVGPVDPDNPVAVGDNDPRVTGTLTHIGDTTVHLSSAQNTFLDSITGAGIVIHKSDDTSVQRTIVVSGTGIAVTNGDGQDGNPTLALADDLLAIEALGGIGIPVRTGSNAWTTRALVAPASGITISNPAGTAGDPTFALANDLAGLEGISTTGLAARTASDTWTARTITGSAGLTVTNGDGVAGNPTLTLGDDVGAIEALTGVGFAARAADNTWALRTITAPAAGLTITPNDGTAIPVFALANDLAAVEGLSATGLAVRTASDTWATRSIEATAGHVEVTNGSGVGGNITVGLPSVGTPVTGQFVTITTDAQGRVSATAAPNAGNITTALGYTPVDVAGDMMTGDLDMNGNSITNVATPVAGTDAANKSYVDSVATGLDIKGSVRTASAADVNLSAPGATISSVSLVNGDRVLIKDQNTPTENGVYVWASAVTPMTRATDFVDPYVTSGAFTFVEEGDLENTGWVLATDGVISVGLTSISFEQFSGAGQITAGTGMTKTGDTLNVGGVAGQIVANANDLGLATTGVTPNTYKSVVVDSYGRVTSGSNPTTLVGYGIVDAQPLDSDLTALAAISSSGILVRTGAGTADVRSITNTVNQTTVTNGTGVSGNITIGLASNPVIPGTTDMIVPTGTSGQESGTTDGAIRYNTSTSKMRMREGASWKDVGTVTSITISPPVEGISVSGGPITGSGTITLTLDDDLAAVEGLLTNGFAVRTGSGSWTTRAITAATPNDRLVVTNGSGVVGDVILDLASSGVSPGTYQAVVVDTYGRVTGGSNPTTLSGYGITDAQPIDTTLTALSNYNTNGFIVQTATDNFTGRILVAPGAGITISNADPTTGNPTFGLANDLAALEGLAGSGIAVRTGADTWAQRTIQGTTDRITLSNGNGASADPIVDIAATYVGQVTITTLGTVTTGSWTANTIGHLYGGTGLSSIGAAKTILGVNTGGTALEYKALTLKGSQSFTFGAIALNDVGTSSNTLTVTGAVVGDIVVLGLPSTVPTGFGYFGYVSAANTITIRAIGSATNGTGAGAANATINVIVMNYTNH